MFIGNQNSIENSLEAIFFSHNQKQIKELFKKNSDLVHYTSATVAHSILTEGKIWLRNISYMNDFQEVLLGQQLLKKSLENNNCELLSRLVNELSDIDSSKNWMDIISNILNNAQYWGLFHTYIACFSEHIPEEKDYGRLSMWRAYGGDNSTALIFNSKSTISKNMGDIFLTKVLYGDEKTNTITNAVTAFIDNIELYFSYLKNIAKQNPTLIEVYVKRALVCAMISIKHIGFKEENEWRLVYFEGEKCNKLKSNIKNINNIPQKNTYTRY